MTTATANPVAMSTPVPPTPGAMPRPPSLWKNNLLMGFGMIVAAAAPHIAVGIYRWLAKG